jgi:ABC-type amino acid transport substrate-binding protein
VVPVEKPLKVHPLYHYVNEKNKNLVEKIDAVIKEMTASGELEKLQKQYAADILKN